MQSPKRNFPSCYSSKSFLPNSTADSFPFFVMECGFCNEKKLTLGKTNNYKQYLLLYSLEGTIRYTKNDTTTYVQPNSVITTACNTTLSFTKVSKSWKFYYFIIGGSHAKFFYNMIRTQDNIIFCSPFSNVLDSFIELFDVLCTSNNSENAIGKYIHASLLIHSIFTSLYDHTYNIREIKDITPAQESNINAALKFISKNYRDDLNIESISAQIGYSKYYFDKIFKKQMGITVHQYLNEYRVNKAKDLLAYSKLSINSIATQVGFKTTLTFIRNFKKVVHMTPSEYRDYY